MQINMYLPVAILEKCVERVVEVVILEWEWARSCTEAEFQSLGLDHVVPLDVRVRVHVPVLTVT